MELPNGTVRRGRFPRIMIMAALVACIGGIAALGARRFREPPGGLNAVRALARSGRFDLAADLLRPYLQARPEDSRAHLLMAQLATEPSHSKPELALEHLRAVRTKSPQEAALVKFFEGKAEYQ